MKPKDLLKHLEQGDRTAEMLEEIPITRDPLDTERISQWAAHAIANSTPILSQLAAYQQANVYNQYSLQQAQNQMWSGGIYGGGIIQTR